MGKFAPFLPILLSLLVIGCDNEVELLESEPAVPIVYGVYNSSQQFQELTITKTFRFAEGEGARESAATPDSVYYSPDQFALVVSRTDTAAEVIAERFNASDEGIVREAGDFSTDTNIAYRFDSAPLDVQPGQSVRLSLQLDDREIASVEQVRLPRLAFPFSPPLTTSYAVTSERPTTFRWEIVDRQFQSLIRTVEVGFNFAFTETRNGETSSRVLYWAGARDLTEQNSTFASVRLDGLFAFLRGALDVDPTVTRDFDYLQLVITAGDQSFRDYRTLLDANRGITSTQELPPFSNIEGGIGLYGSITQLRQDPGARLSTAGFDALYGRDGDPFGMLPYNFQP